jgi:cutinase
MGVAAAAVCAVLSAPAQTVSAAPCPDVEVVFARGTGELPGIGGVGQAFVDSLRAKAGAKSVDVYAVNYPATTDFPRAVDGINDAAAHIQATATNCPKTEIVLGGYSQGAAVAGFVTSDVVPPGAVDSGVTGPMPPAIADHVAAVTLFGTPSSRFMGMINEPDIVIGPLYTDKTLQSCVPGDPICSDGGNYSLHDQYIQYGLTDQAADFAVSKLTPGPTTPRSGTPAPAPGLAAVPEPVPLNGGA